MSKKSKTSKSNRNTEQEVVIHGPTLYMREPHNSKAFLKREFLNDASSLDASFVLGVVASSDEGQFLEGFNALILCDSFRVISLEFPLSTRKARSASLFKIGILLSTIKDFREALLFEATAIENAGEAVDQK